MVDEEGEGEGVGVGGAVEGIPRGRPEEVAVRNSEISARGLRSIISEAAVAKASICDNCDG